MPWTLMLPGVATISASTAAETTLPKNARSPCYSVANASSLAEDTKRTVLAVAKVAIRLAAPRKKKKAQPPGMRIKASKRKKKTRARVMIGPSPSKECSWTKQELDSRIMKPWLQSQEKPNSEAPIWVCQGQ